MSKLGLIGVGIVGSAFYEGMKHAFEIVRYDKNKPENSDVHSISDLLKVVDGPIFVCVPTPMQRDGSASIENIQNILNEIKFSYNEDVKKIVVIKSTVPPGTCEKLDKQYLSVSVVFNPEFLTEANPVEDFKKQDRIILGGNSEPLRIVSEIYSRAYSHVPIKSCSLTEAEMIKYFANCFLATKVSFANEMHQICSKLGIDYNKVKDLASLDKRLGVSHWSVPGPDTHQGFGGSCFPKDINALISRAKELGVDPKVMEAAWNKNLEVRPEKDWESLKGRAVL